MKKFKVFIACDTSIISKAKEIINKTKNKKLKIGYKFGLEFFYSKKGRSFLSTLKNENIFLDLKLNDIPNTCKSAIKSIKDLKNINYLSVHTNGGLKMLKEIKKNSGKIKILGVTTLTSLDNRAVKEIGYRNTLEKIIIKQVMLAKKAKLNGIVCSAKELKFVKRFSSNMEIFTPGIRLIGDKIDDQKRVTSPKEAFKNGSTAIVIGRSITKGSIKKNVKKLIESLN